MISLCEIANPPIEDFPLLCEGNASAEGGECSRPPEQSRNGSPLGREWRDCEGLISNDNSLNYCHREGERC